MSLLWRKKGEKRNRQRRNFSSKRIFGWYTFGGEFSRGKFSVGRPRNILVGNNSEIIEMLAPGG